MLRSLIKSNPKFQPRDMLSATGLILVIFSTIIVILLADTDEQLTAAMGVLGSIAGFLFGPDFYLAVSTLGVIAPKRKKIPHLNSSQ